MLGSDKPALGCEGKLKRGIICTGRGTDRTSRDLHILSFNGRTDICRSDSTYSHFRRIHPDAHAVVSRTKGAGTTHSLQTRQFVDDMQLGIVRKIKGIVSLRIVALKRYKQQDIARPGIYRNALLSDRVRQLRGSLADEILDLYGCIVEIRTVFERNLKTV